MGKEKAGEAKGTENRREEGEREEEKGKGEQRKETAVHGQSFRGPVMKRRKERYSFIEMGNIPIIIQTKGLSSVHHKYPKNLPFT